uniref:Uncharacterized protein n=1 Tax=Knipowitschia caucasica TaxID=637954 RepID=A0AAV2JM08_KNICA
MRPPRQQLPLAPCSPRVYLFCVAVLPAPFPRPPRPPPHLADNPASPPRRGSAPRAPPPPQAPPGYSPAHRATHPHDISNRKAVSRSSSSGTPHAPPLILRGSRVPSP